MKKNEVIGTITDQTGHAIEIKDGEKYTIVFEKDNKIEIQQHSYHNYPSDMFIGKDDEEGWSHGARIFFDGYRVNNKGIINGIIPIVVSTDKDFITKIKETFNF